MKKDPSPKELGMFPLAAMIVALIAIGLAGTSLVMTVHLHSQVERMLENTACPGSRWVAAAGGYREIVCLACGLEMGVHP